MKKIILSAFAILGLNAAIAQTTDTASYYKASAKTQTVTPGSQTVKSHTTSNGTYNSDGSYNSTGSHSTKKYNSTDSTSTKAGSKNGTKKTTTKSTTSYTTTPPSK